MKPTDLLSVNQLNAFVTEAILDAEHFGTRSRWLRVAEFEKALSERAETELERDIARLGVETAMEKAEACSE